jgi:hypothetical protein
MPLPFSFELRIDRPEQTVNISIKPNHRELRNYFPSKQAAGANAGTKIPWSAAGWKKII